MRVYVLAMAILYIALTCAVADERVAQAAQGEAPKTVKLAALLDMIALNKGKVVVVNFFATWCPPCKEEIPGLVSIATSYPADKVVIIGVSVDQKPAVVNPFIKNLKVNYPVFHAGSDVSAAFGIRTIPHNVIYDTQGTMEANVTGFVTEKDLKEYITMLLEQKKQ